MGCRGGVLTCIQVLYVLGQPSVHHTHVCTIKPAYVRKYVGVCTNVHVHTYIHYTHKI